MTEPEATKTSSRSTEPRLVPSPDELAPSASMPDSETPAGVRPAFAPLRGLLAGAVATGVMTAAQYAYQRAAGSPSSSTPAKATDFVLGKLGGKGLSRRQLRSPAVTNAIHIAYGTSWGAVYSTAGAVLGRPLSGVGFGSAVWGAGLALMPAVGVSTAPWKQDPRGLAAELGFHLIYGSSLAAADRVLRGGEVRATDTVAPVSLGVSAGMRTFTPPAVTAFRRSAPTGVRVALALAALGEIGWWDKHPDTPGRTELQGMVGRAAGGAGSAWPGNGLEGALLAGTTAVAAGVALEALRGRLVDGLGVADPLFGLVEDALAIAIAVAGSAPGGD